MNRGLYTAATGLIVNQRKMDVISNNLANGNTTGFKKDIAITESFPDVLLSKLNGKPDMDNHKPFTGVRTEENDGVYTLSIDSGYFRVQTPTGISHNRELRFIVDEDGYLKTHYKDHMDIRKTHGENYVLGRDGQPIRVEDGNINIDDQGNITSNGAVVGSLVTFPHPRVIGTISSGVRFDKIVTDFTQGNLMETGNSLDFALQGEGFFKVQSPNGVLYTRDGSFTISDSGELITTEGYHVLGEDGIINLNGREFTIDERGNVIQDGRIIDRLAVVNIGNKEYLRKQGYNLYRILEGVEAEEEPYQGQVLRGYLEGSNVNTIREMVEMITLQRNYETSQKLISAHDEMLGKAVNEIARV